MIISSFNDVVRYLNGSYTKKQDYGKLPDPLLHIEREKYLLSLFDHPENSFKAIHIAGSKGKGTTAAYTAGLLRGYSDKIGLYLSPHVFSYKERWSFVDFFTRGIRYFSDEAYIKCAIAMEEKLGDHTALTDLPGNVPPSPFELYTLFAALLFRQENIELAVIETGIGGRCDATNVFNSIASVITHIEKEHAEILGRSLEEITREKCGIIKPNTPTFTYTQSDEVMNVIKEEASAKNSELIIAEVNTKVKNFAKTSLMRGEAAKNDLALAIKVAEHIKGSKILSPITDIKLPCRGELIIDENCAYILDGAHTKDSIANAIKNFSTVLKKADFDEYVKHQDFNEDEISSLIEMFDEISMKRSMSECIAIFACSKNKDVEGMAEELLKTFKTIYITELEDKNKAMRITDELIAFEKAQNKMDKVKTKQLIPQNSLDACLNHIHHSNGEEYPVYVAILGSFYLCGEFRDDASRVFLHGIKGN